MEKKISLEELSLEELSYILCVNWSTCRDYTVHGALYLAVGAGVGVGGVGGRGGAASIDTEMQTAAVAHCFAS